MQRSHTSSPELAERVLAGERRALARLITLVENRDPAAREQIKQLYPASGRARILGLTGAPGTGKSTLVRALVRGFRARGQTVGVVAVDPTSPFTGGAILGDRVRMTDLTGDSGVFVRSMATRGALGGLSRATADVVTILDAFGMDIVLIETVGVGQDEVEIAKTAYTTMVVTVPGLGDDIQAIKAGILEIADIFVINKADRDGANRLSTELKMMMSLAKYEDWRPPIVKTIASQEQGIAELIDATERHWEFLQANDRLSEKKAELARRHVLAIAQETLLEKLVFGTNGDLGRLAHSVARRETDPYTAAQQLTEDVRGC